MAIAFRLITGEYVIASEAKGSSDRYVLTDPHQLITHQEGNAVQLRLMPWLNTRKVKLYKTSIVAELDEKEIPEHIKDAFMQVTSGVAIAREMPKPMMNS